jgi:hypothetical protein
MSTKPWVYGNPNPIPKLSKIHSTPNEFSALRATSRAENERAEIGPPLPCRTATCLGAPVALQQSRILPASHFILSRQERSRIVR